MHLLWVMLIFLVLYMVKLVKGPAIWDRFLALNLISTKMVIIIIVFASMYDTAYLLDLAIISTLLWFICIIFTALFLKDRKTGGMP